MFAFARATSSSPLLTLGVALLLVFAPMQQAQATLLTSIGTPLQQAFNWQQTWGSIDFSSDNDPLIPATQLQPKEDIKVAVGVCGTNKTDLSSIKTYSIDFDANGLADVITDASAYFTNYSNGCATEICTAEDGCYLSIYRAGEATNLISDAPTTTKTTNTTTTTTTTTNTTKDTQEDLCPKTAAANKACLAYCPATQANCPGLFQYSMEAEFNSRVKAWTYISFSAFAQKVTAGESYRLINSRPVLVTLLNNNKCYEDELILNNNQCIKYYQFDGENFVDLYVYQDYSKGEFDTRFTYTPFDRAQSHLAQGLALGGGFGHKLAAKGSLDQQFESFTRILKDGTTTTGFLALHIENASNDTYFVPSNTEGEFNAFLNSLPNGVTVTTSPLKFTEWVGDTDCSAIHAPYGQTISIAAQRFCQRSTSAYAPCEECVDAKIDGYEQGCTLTQQCVGTECTISSPYGGAAYVGQTTTMEDCLSGTDPYWVGVYYKHGGYSNFAQMCNNWFVSLCVQGTDCLAPATLVSLPEGKTKPVSEIKAGEKILGFDRVDGEMKAMRVAKIAVTPNQTKVRLNDNVTLTKTQVILTSDGKWTTVSDLKVGDKLITGDKKELAVKSIMTEPGTETVYNLQLDGGIGFLANGLRVESHLPSDTMIAP